MRYRKLGLLLGFVVLSIAVAGTAMASTPAAGDGASSIPVIEDSQLQATFTESTGGTTPTATTRTIPNWFGTTLDPHNGVTYGYTMAGANPNTCTGSACNVTIQADITPLNVIINYNGGQWMFSGSSIVNGTLASPQFASNDYGSTPAATAAGAFPNAPAFIKGPGGVLSQGDAGIPLQLQDATMRAQFNQTGPSNYHLRLNPHVNAPVTINVPQNQGTLLQSGRGVIFADVDIQWWSSQIKNLENQADATHLPIYLTDDVMLYTGNNPGNCCVIGYHGTQPTGAGLGSGNSNGNAVLQTFAWASWVSPGIFSRPNGGTDWALQDIHALSHEIAEWGDDPFVNNGVEPWLTPTAPQYGCTGILETGDPVVGIGFSMGTNTTDQTPNPWTSPTNHSPSISYDGTYHPEDEVYMPWFLRLAPNTVSEPTQSPSVNGGRYSLMGDLNPFPGFRQPATGC